MSNAIVTESQSANSRVLGILWIIYGLARILLAVWLLAFQTTAKLMFGSMLSRVPNPYTLMDTFQLFYAVIVLASVACGILGILAGFALRGNWSSARALALAAAFLSLPEMPLGLMLGVYTIALLLPRHALRTTAALP
jgi:hypothetical protein